MKQVTGRDQREIKRYIVAAIAGGVPNNVLLAVRNLRDFRYLGQASTLTSSIRVQMVEALKGFHAHKEAIMNAKVCVRKNGLPMNHWQITKLELLQSAVSSIMASGVISQYSADIMEHAHITKIKKPACLGNNQNYEAQIV